MQQRARYIYTASWARQGKAQKALRAEREVQFPDNIVSFLNY